MSHVQLTIEQEKTAQDIIEGLEAGEVTRPQDILDVWRVRPEIAYEGLEDGEYFEEVSKWVDVNRICGTGEGNINRLEPGRLVDVLDKLLEGEFELKRPEGDRPQLLQFDSEYFVGSDGIHRSVACNAVGVEQIYADVQIIR